jgi:hypothetical protein
MRTIKFELDIGFCGCGDEGTMTVSDDMTNAEIDEMVHDMAMDHAQSWEGDERLGWGNEDEDQDEVTEQFYENVGGSWQFVENEE